MQIPRWLPRGPLRSTACGTASTTVSTRRFTRSISHRESTSRRGSGREPGTIGTAAHDDGMPAPVELGWGRGRAWTRARDALTVREDGRSLAACRGIKVEDGKAWRSIPVVALVLWAGLLIVPGGSDDAGPALPASSFRSPPRLEPWTVERSLARFGAPANAWGTVGRSPLSGSGASAPIGARSGADPGREASLAGGQFRRPECGIACSAGSSQDLRVALSEMAAAQYRGRLGAYRGGPRVSGAAACCFPAGNVR